MSRFSVSDIKDFPSLQRAFVDLVERLDAQGIDIGHPQNPYNASDTTLAGDVTVAAPHNGFAGNVEGSWVEVELNASTGNPATLTCNHNLNIPVTSGLLNVRWQVCGWIHDGTGLSGAITTTAIYLGGTVTANAINLYLSVVGTLTVDNTHPVKISLRFFPVQR